MGVADPSPESLRVKIGQGLTGWVAAHKRTLRIGDAAADQRSVRRGEADQPESMLVVPMLYEDAVHGVIVISRIGRDQFDADDETTFSIFAGYAALALVNASNLGRLEQHQAELQHQLTSQRRLLEVNERLLSTLEPSSVLDLIADSLKAIVPYDSLTVYRVDREAGVRRAVIARDMFADLILANENSLGRRYHRLGHRARRGRPLEPGAARSARDPGARHAGGARGDDRRAADGPRRDDRHPEHRPGRECRGVLLDQRVRADEALCRPGLDRTPERRGPWRGPGPCRAGCPDRAAQPRRLPARARRGCRDRWRRAPVRGPDDGPRRLQAVQRRARASGRGRPADGDRARDGDRDPGRRPPLPLRRRRVRRDPAQHRPHGRPRRGRTAAPQGRRAVCDRVRRGHDQHRGRLLPRGRTGEGRARRDRRPGDVPRQARGHGRRSDAVAGGPVPARPR